MQIQLIEVKTRRVLDPDVIGGGTYDFRPGDRTLAILPVPGAATYRIQIDNDPPHTEAKPPYHVCGDDVPWIPAAGAAHTLVIDALAANGSTVTGARLTITADNSAPPPKPVDYGPATITNQSQLDSLYLRGGPRAGEIVVLGPGNYLARKTMPVHDGAVIASAADGTAWITWAGPAPASGATPSVFSLGGAGPVISALGVECKGAAHFATIPSGSGAVVAFNSAGSPVSFVMMNESNARGVQILRNVCPEVLNYFTFTSGKKTTTTGGVVTDPPRDLTMDSNVCGASRWMHVLRFHDLIKAVVRRNDFRRGNPQGAHTGCVGKIHDGEDFDFDGNNLAGLYEGSSPGYFVIGPLPGGDGGLRKPPGPERDRLLRLQLTGMKFRNNKCDDLTLTLFPGAKNFVIDNNVLARVRDMPVCYKPTEAFTRDDGEQDPGDYRPWRGEITGAIMRNTITTRAGVTLARGWTNTPPAVARSGNSLNGEPV